MSQDDSPLVKLVWVVKVGRCRVCCGSFRDAFNDFISHDFGTAIVYPMLMRVKYFESLREHEGW